MFMILNFVAHQTAVLLVYLFHCILDLDLTADIELSLVHITEVLLELCLFMMSLVTQPLRTLSAG